jgi:cardiolipin synthase
MNTKQHVSPLALAILSLLALFIICSSGCASLPNVSTMIAGTPATRQPPQINTARGVLSPEKSRAIMLKLQKSVEPTDILLRHTAVMEEVLESPLTKGNKVALLVDGKDTYAAMFKAMENAKDHINLETYIIEEDETGHRFIELLLKKQAEGVQVNLIYDSVGSFGTSAAFFQRLSDAGIQVVEFNPIKPLQFEWKWLQGHPDHRKLLVVDGRIAITGGINISNVYSSTPFRRKRAAKAALPWRDTDVQIEGPAVAEFQKLFVDTWQRQTGPPLTSRDYFPVLKEKGNALVQAVGSNPGESNRNTFVVYVSAITFAEHSLHLTNAYFIPDEQILAAFTAAASRGVDVKIILPSTTDSWVVLHAQRHNYSALLQSGVKLYERRNALLHAKTAVIDNVWSTVGSTNMDYWSFLNNDEVNAVILSREVAGEMEKMFARDLAESRQIHLKMWRERPVLPRTMEWLAHLFARWI